MYKALGTAEGGTTRTPLLQCVKGGASTGINMHLGEIDDMGAPRRLCLLLLTTALLTGVQVGTAQADQTSQLRTSGGTAYGGSSNFEVRRPALPANSFYDFKTGVRRFDKSLLFAGHRSAPDGKVVCIRQVVSSTGIPSTQIVADCNGIKSFDGLYAAFRNPEQGVLETRYESAGIVDFSLFEDTFDIEFDSILVRGYMTHDDAALSKTLAGSLRYQTTPNDINATANWGPPYGEFVTTRACGRRILDDAFWSHAYNNSC
jgi:hypothetical protein